MSLNTAMRASVCERKRRRASSSHSSVAKKLSQSALKLLCPSSRFGPALGSELRSAEVAEDLARHSPLEAAHDLPLRPALGEALCNVGQRRRMAAHTRDHDPV